MKGKKKIKSALNFIRALEGWNCELISSAITMVQGDEVWMIYYKQISENPAVTPCIRWAMFVNGEHKAGGVIR